MLYFAVLITTEALAIQRIALNLPESIPPMEYVDYYVYPRVSEGSTIGFTAGSHNIDFRSPLKISRFLGGRNGRYILASDGHTASFVERKDDLEFIDVQPSCRTFATICSDGSIIRLIATPRGLSAFYGYPEERSFSIANYMLLSSETKANTPLYSESPLASAQGNKYAASVVRDGRIATVLWVDAMRKVQVASGKFGYTCERSSSFIFAPKKYMGCSAEAMNSKGDVAGILRRTQGRNPAFLWQNGKLLTLPWPNGKQRPGHIMMPQLLTDSGVVVGTLQNHYSPELSALWMYRDGKTVWIEDALSKGKFAEARRPQPSVQNKNILVWLEPTKTSVEKAGWFRLVLK